MRDILTDMPRRHSHLLCVDSDGCAFDTMALKQKECFYPALEEAWNLQAVSRYALETMLFVSLFSTSRGVNRYPALVRTLRLLARRPEARAAGFTCPDLSALEEWISSSPSLSLGALEQHMRLLGRPEPSLERAAQFARGADQRIAQLVRDIPPFPHAAEALRRFSRFADIVVISTATHEDLQREWSEHGLLPYVTEVAGQEQGSKAECIRRANSGHYPLENVLMIGDAPGDRRAAKEAGALFYPILAAHEAESWRRAEEEIAERFKEGSYAGRVMDKILEEFDSSLLKDPPWQQLPDEDMQ